jgi:small-conductance mechanosensitive channel
VARTILKLLLVAGALAGATSQAQQPISIATNAAPEFPTLRQDWWAEFEGAPEDVEPRIASLLEQVEGQIPDLAVQNQATASAVLQAVRDNFAVYVSLLGGVDIEKQALPEPAASYTIDELLDVAAQAREAQAAADDARIEVEREQRILDGASRRRDAIYKEYVAATDGDTRWLAALRVVRTRSAQAIAELRLDALTENADRADAHAANASERIELVQQRLATYADTDVLAELMTAVAIAEESLADREERARESQIAASSLDVDTAEGRSEQRLLQQRALDAEIEFAAARIALAHAEARQFWTELKLDTDLQRSFIEDKVFEWSEASRDIGALLPDWQRQTEDELLAVQGADRDGLSRNARRILDQRIGTAQESLAHIGQLEGAIADLDLLMVAVDNAILEYSGPLSLWLSNVGRSLRTAWQRANEMTETTLFSVGETPVTAGDIVQALLILVIGWLLSRGIRIAIRRMGSNESVGVQASLYTISRLTHYTIIIVAIFVALTSIGLDFTSLALVAGALSVGIGFGLQSIVNNFVSGLIILFERTLRVGDYIELDNGLTGTVKAINVRSTLINTNDNIDIVVPNSEFVSTRLTNWTLAEHILRMRIPFGVAYGSDKETVKKAAIEACEHVSFTLTNMPGREPDVWLVEYGDSSLNFLLLVWVNRQGARRPTRTRAAYLWALEDKLSEYGIEIPFPQRDLNLRSGWPEPQPPQAAEESASS